MIATYRMQRLMPAAVLGLAVALSGCGRRQVAPPPSVNQPTPQSAQQTSVKVFFADPKTALLRPVERQVPAATPATGALQALADGPGPDEDLEPVLPGPEAIKGVTIRGKVAVVNLSAEFANALPGGTAGLLSIYGIVNTLTGIGDIEAVQFRVEGQEVAALGELDGRGPYRYNADMVAPEGEPE
jgi:spore germination protein GerM